MCARVCVRACVDHASHRRRFGRTSVAAGVYDWDLEMDEKSSLDAHEEKTSAEQAASAKDDARAEWMTNILILTQ